MTAPLTKEAFLGPPKLAKYVPAAFPMGGYGIDGQAYFQLNDVWKMRRDPQIQFILRIIKAPLTTVTWTVECDDANAQAWIDRTAKRFWTRDLQKASKIAEFGSVGGELEWRDDEDTGLVEYESLKDVQFLQAHPLHIQGKLAGVRVPEVGHSKEKHPNRLTPPKSFWVTLDAESGSFWGMPRIAGCWQPWREKSGRHGALDIRRLWFVKYAFRGYKGWYPPGETEISPGVFKDNQDFMREIVEQAETGNIPVFPTIFEEKSGKPLWDIEAPEAPPDVPGLIQYPKELDEEMLRGAGIHPEVAKAAESGSGWAGRSLPFMVFFTAEDAIADAILTAFDEQAIKPGVAVNFGSHVKYEIKRVSLVPKPEQQPGNKSLGTAGMEPGNEGGAGDPSSLPPGGPQPVPAPTRMSADGKDEPLPVPKLIAADAPKEEQKVDDFNDRFSAESPWAGPYTGEHGGTYWVHAGSGTKQYGHERPGSREPAQQPAKPAEGRSLGKMVQALRKLPEAEHLAKEWVSSKAAENVAKLPPEWQERVEALWWATKLGTKILFSTYIAGQTIAQTTATMAGMSESGTGKLKAICSTLDLVGAKAVPLTMAALGASGGAAMAASFLPVASAGATIASVGYLVYATASDPAGVWERAKAAVKGLGRRKEQLSAEGEAAVKRLAEAIKAHGDSDWFHALVCAALDQADGLDAAIDMAEEAMGETERLSVERLGDGPHKFSSTQFDLIDAGYSRSQGSPVPALQKMASSIPDADLAGDGRESNFHVTVKYGLHTRDAQEVNRLVEGFGSITARLGKTSIFPGEQADVVKVDVEGEGLRRLNNLISDSLECTDTHPEYRPHVTLAYVKPGLGQKYVGLSDVDGMTVDLAAMKFSAPEGQVTEIDLIKPWGDRLSLERLPVIDPEIRRKVREQAEREFPERLSVDAPAPIPEPEPEPKPPPPVRMVKVKKIIRNANDLILEVRESEEPA